MTTFNIVGSQLVCCCHIG